ncbi:MAG: hypothetical protein HQK62_01450 [Desulfamplus sp.]|nr:hypothetical protein [Desulfamplus sp.]
MKKKIFFICGSMNQTTQMHQISRHLGDYDHAFSPFYVNGFDEFLRKLGMIEFTIAGNKLTNRCRDYLHAQGLPIDEKGKQGAKEEKGGKEEQGKNRPYDLVVTCSDVYLQKNIKGNRIVLVQEGITDPESFMFHLVNKFRFLPLWFAGNALTGLSDAYEVFCVASEGYRDFFIKKGVRSEKIVVTGIPNFDKCSQYSSNTFPHRNFVLACTSALRETLQFENRRAFIRKAVEIAGSRQLIFKLHPSEKVRRATREINKYAPGAMVFSCGNAEEMIANCDVLITRFSSTALVGLALGKETHSDFNMEEMRRLTPVQNGSAALNIASVCRRLLERKALC